MDAEKLYREIPSLDLADFTSGNTERKDKFIRELGSAFQNIGFAAIKNHGLSEELTDRLYDVIKRFFMLPDATKRKYEIEGLHGQRGYTSKGKEHAKGRTTGDLKEFYHVGQDGNQGLSAEEYPQNIWPAELPEMEAVCNNAYKTLENAGIELLRAIALYLGLDENYFDTKVKGGQSILRPIHYFPIENPEEILSDAVRAAAHGDINLITLLMGASADGLQILRRDGKWIPITALPEQIVVNVGDMLARHTNDKLKSTIHQVVNPPKEKMKNSRFSIPFFMHPRAEMDLSCLPNCIDAEHPKKYEDITAGAFLAERLAEIGLKK